MQKNSRFPGLTIFKMVWIHRLFLAFFSNTFTVITINLVFTTLFWPFICNSTQAFETTTMITFNMLPEVAVHLVNLFRVTVGTLICFVTMSLQMLKHVLVASEHPLATFPRTLHFSFVGM